jgi:hypothetical protein
VPINPDGTFSVRAHAARHRVDFGGMPSGYSLGSVQVNGRDTAQGLVLDNTDVTGVVITVKAPRDLPSIRGTIAGLPPKATVEMRGPIVGALTATPDQSGRFEFRAATPGLYYLRVPQVPTLGVTHVVVGWDGATVNLKAP